MSKQTLNQSIVASLKLVEACPAAPCEELAKPQDLPIESVDAVHSGIVVAPQAACFSQYNEYLFLRVVMPGL